MRKETDYIESRLGKILEKTGFKVFTSYKPIGTDAGEIDLIAIYGNHVIIAEVKSTYIRSSIQEIHEYKNFTLNKASYQLDKKVEYIKKYFLKEHFSDLSEVVLHTWVIDTTLEFDHEYIGDHLKVSLDEIIISLNGHKDFMDSFVNSDFDLKKSIDRVDPIQFLESIENNLFWNKQIGNYDDNLQGMLQKLSSKM
ncbi:NERD domain-containing protein [Acinetobacter sp. ASP199]|uniref:NERD domain-containing protein n=1 Tax=unclassified Acinetobacter TaxID=196816 RepID=UPI001F6071F6|nr:NERD domain-containing protein [Acinetobacter sp. ASP199]UNT58111.1 NERD domain-containing protein [Acinetobacter sp. ASP199]